MLKKIAKFFQQTQVLVIWRLKFGHFPQDERHWWPVWGLYDCKPTEWPRMRMVFDGEQSVWFYWGMWEVTVKLKHRRAQCVRGIVQ